MAVEFIPQLLFNLIAMKETAPHPTDPVPPRPGIERPAPTARRIAEASISPNARRTYSGALRRLDA